ncbi:MAG: hypothetical protein R6T96_12455 [Longimicrobiales bacterium]
MTVYYRRTTPGPRENLGAGLAAVGLAAAVGAATFYLARLLLAREPFFSGPPGRAGRGEAGTPAQEISEFRED